MILVEINSLPVIKLTQLYTDGGLFLYIRGEKMNFKSENFLNQKNILKDRNMSFYDEDRAVKTLSYISYYRIKEFAEPFAKREQVQNGPEKINYNGIKFETIISRYYQDKNFRMHLLHVIEDIEVALQTQISYVLGDATGDYGYLDFSLWIDRTNNSILLQKAEREILRNLKYQIKKNQTKELAEKLKYGKNNVYPPVWLAIKMLMFGDLLKILRIMSKKNLTRISQYFNCTNKQLVSWLGTINLIRNISAHNSNLIDINLRTRPLIDENWKKYLFTNSKEQISNNKVSIILLIVIHFMEQINNKYNFKNVNESVVKLIKNDKTAHYYGFNSKNDCINIFPKGQYLSRKKNKKKNKRKNKI